ncbi:immunity 53 family protein [Longispora albida]|uniref:immunity 53 family protein n=1 Tax=Longispora albida TaxID=203523 RepID=UPI000364D5E1|nr:immunity 53 family protein [Longispora albida]
MNQPGHVFDWLQAWYLSQCDGDWEHSWGVTIDTLDNPGWTVKINLQETDLAGREFPRLQTTRSEHDWVMVWTSQEVFQIACGPGNLSEALALFREWAASSGEPKLR